MEIKNVYIEGIPFTTYHVESKEKKPLIFFFHGYGGNRESGIMGRGEILAKKGFFVIAMDAYLHGERSLPFFNQLKNEDKQKDIINIIMHTARDAKYLYQKYLKYWNIIDPKKVYAYGVSMGAAVSFYLATVMDELKTIASIVGSPSFYDFYKYKKDVFKWEEDDYYKRNLETYLDECPLIHSDRLKEKNIFMGCGDKDLVVPGKYAKRLEEKMSSDHIICQFYETDHYSTDEMQEDAYQFILSH